MAAIEMCDSEKNKILTNLGVAAIERCDSEKKKDLNGSRCGCYRKV